MIVLVLILLPVLGLSYLWIPRAHTASTADLEIPPGTVPPCWNSYIYVYNLPTVNVKDYLRAYVWNLGPADASSANVTFYISKIGAMSANGPGWQLVGTSAPFSVSKNSGVWCPPVGWKPAESGHHCVQAVVNYQLDPNPNNNKAQRNVNILPWPTGGWPAGGEQISFNVWAPVFNEAFTVDLEYNSFNSPPNVNFSGPTSVSTPVNGSVSATLTITVPSGVSPTPFNVTVTATYTNGTVYGGFLVEVSVYDVAVTNLTSYHSIQGRGLGDRMNVTVANYGSYTETFNVTEYANTTIIGTQEVTVPTGDICNQTYVMNTAGFTYGNYTITANVTLASGETNTWTGPFTYGTVEVTIPGDVDGNHVVNVLDVVHITSIYGSKLGSSNFNPNADIDGDGKITILDVVTCTSHYGQKWS